MGAFSGRIGRFFKGALKTEPPAIDPPIGGDLAAEQRANLGLPNVYRAVITPSGAAPTISQEFTQLGGSLSVASDEAGTWTITLTGAFPANRTKVWLETLRPGALLFGIQRQDDDTLTAQFVDISEAGTEPVRAKMLFIEVFPT